MIDLNVAEQQSTSTGRGPIPPDSCVIVQMHLRSPKANKQGSHALLGRSDKGNEYLDAEFKVCSPTYEDKAIWQNLTVIGSDQAVKISMRMLRAIVESARNLDPNDQSPEATEARKLQDWSDLEGIRFMVKVDAKAEVSYKDGKTYINNHIKRVITPDMEEYAIVARDGEIITSNPLPTEAAAPKAAPAMGKLQAPTWGGQLASNADAQSSVKAEPSTASPATTSHSKPSGGLPTWAKK